MQHLVVPSELSDEEIEDFNPQLGMGSPDWDVFDDRGRFLGTLTMPTKYQPLSFVGEDIYGIWRDDLDVQYVMKLRITGMPGADKGGIPIAE